MQQDTSNSDQLNVTPVARVESPFKQKFAIPRQPNLVKEAQGEIVFQNSFNDPDLLRRIEDFSHLWLIFIFHATADQGWSSTVQPPRLGGKEKVGVFASRSPFRPNSIGLSVVENLGRVKSENRLAIKIGGLDLLDGTPVLDIKPYLPYADSIPNALAGYAQQQPGEQYIVDFSAQAMQVIKEESDRLPDLQQLISALLSQDPRPAWRVKPQDDKQYGIALYDLNIKWQVHGNTINVTAISPLTDTNQTTPFDARD